VTPRILPAAVEDLERGRDFYEESEEGIGDYFVQTVLSEVESLRLYAGVHPKRFGFHWFMVRRFPWAIYYEIEETLPVVYRILDCRADPTTNREALKTHGEQDGAVQPDNHPEKP